MGKREGGGGGGGGGDIEAARCIMSLFISFWWMYLPFMFYAYRRFIHSCIIVLVCIEVGGGVVTLNFL